VTGNQILKAIPKESVCRRWVEAWPTATPPKSFMLFSALSMLGAALGRKVWLDQDVHILYPMLNLLLIGPSGTGKSTSITQIGRPLLDALPKIDQPQFIAGSTPEKLHKDLRVKPHAVLFASELANFFNKQKYMESMIPYVTELLDYPRVLQRRTVGGGVEEVVRPEVSVIGGSTVDWLQGQLPDSATSGGFLARFLIVTEEHAGNKVAHPKLEVSKTTLAKLRYEREELSHEFVHLVLNHKGEIDYGDYEAIDEYAYWYAGHKPANGHLAPFAARAGEFVQRLAMLIAISCDRHEITAVDVKAAIQLYEYCAAKLQDVVVPFTVQGKLLSMVLQSVGQEQLTEVDIMKSMRNFVGAIEVRRLIDSLLASKDLKRLPDGKFERVRAS
jgi:hypothetical protein